MIELLEKEVHDLSRFLTQIEKLEMSLKLTLIFEKIKIEIKKAEQELNDKSKSFIEQELKGKTDREKGKILENLHKELEENYQNNVVGVNIDRLDITEDLNSIKITMEQLQVLKPILNYENN